MDRRSFLTGWAQGRAVAAPANHSSSFHERTLSTGLEPWVPSASQPWDAVRAGHLLRRTMMLPKWADMDTLLKLSPSAAVDQLLNTPSDPTPPSIAGKVTHSLRGLDTAKTSEQKAEWAGDDGKLKDWYANVLLNSPLSIVEKMTFFWSGHFTSQFVADESFVVAPLLYNQNTLFRNTGLQNFRDLTLNVTLDGAMLVYLGGAQSSVQGKGPNENYARELMELFTMGIGNYTEGDVKEAAKILTGWKVAQFSDDPFPNGYLNTYFSRVDHDLESKNFLGVTFSAIADADNTQDLVKKNEIEKLIDTIFTVRKAAVAKFICRKIYKFFVYSNPAGTDEAVIDAMAQLFIANQFDIKPVVSTLLKSAHFFDNGNLGCQIKTPAEFIIGIARQLGYTSNMAGNMMTMLQELFNPPNVSGWPGWHDWITTNTYPVRSTVVTAAIAGMSDKNVLDFINQFPDADDANLLITHLGALMLPRKLAPARHDDLVSRLVGGGKDYEWPSILSTSTVTAAHYMRDVLTTICNLPDFQLC